MNVNVSMKKSIIAIVVLSIVGLVGYNQYRTRDARRAEAEYKRLVKFANRQAVEIMIIEQRSKLLDYQRQINAASQPTKIAQPMRPNPPMPAPFVPALPDPNDIE